MLLRTDDEDTTATRNHLHGGHRVPAGVGTLWKPRVGDASSGCPGVFGPVPQPVLMDSRRLPEVFSHVNLFMRMKR